MMEFRISAAALADLKQIWRFTCEKWSVDQADRYFHLLMDEIEFLCLNPQSGVDYRAIRPGYFKTRVKSHLIFYRVNHRDNQIEVMRILHQKMDVDNELRNE